MFDALNDSESGLTYCSGVMTANVPDSLSSSSDLTRAVIEPNRPRWGLSLYEFRFLTMLLTALGVVLSYCVPARTREATSIVGCGSR